MIERFQEQQAKEEPMISKDVSVFSKGLKFVAISALVATLALSCNVLFGSATQANYLENRDFSFTLTHSFVPSFISCWPIGRYNVERKLLRDKPTRNSEVKHFDFETFVRQNVYIKAGNTRNFLIFDIGAKYNSKSMEKVLQLNQANLSEVGSRIPVPQYDRSDDKIGIVHIGVGGFHRAHQAYYLHQLRQLDEASDWGICGIGLREADSKLNDIFKTQEHLYTLMVKHPNGKIEPEVIGSIVDFKMGTTEPEPVIAQMAAAGTKIVSLTITEGGYNFNPTTGEFNFDNPDIQHELQNPNDPKTVYGFLTAALKRRRDAGLPVLPFWFAIISNIMAI